MLVFGKVLQPKNKRRYTISTSFCCSTHLVVRPFQKGSNSSTTNTSHLEAFFAPKGKTHLNQPPVFQVPLLLVSGRVLRIFFDLSIKKQKQLFNSQLMVNWWLGFLGSPCERDCCLGTPLESQTTGPQTNN